MILTLADKKKARDIARDRLHRWLDGLRLSRMLSHEEYRDLKDAVIIVDRFRHDGRLDPNARSEETSVDFTNETAS